MHVRSGRGRAPAARYCGPAAMYTSRLRASVAAIQCGVDADCMHGESAHTQHVPRRQPRLRAVPSRWWRACVVARAGRGGAAVHARHAARRGARAAGALGLRPAGAAAAVRGDGVRRVARCAAEQPPRHCRFGRGKGGPGVCSGIGFHMVQVVAVHKRSGDCLTEIQSILQLHATKSIDRGMLPTPKLHSRRRGPSTTNPSSGQLTGSADCGGVYGRGAALRCGSRPRRYVRRVLSRTDTFLEWRFLCIRQSSCSCPAWCCQAHTCCISPLRQGSRRITAGQSMIKHAVQTPTSGAAHASLVQQAASVAT